MSTPPSATTSFAIPSLRNLTTQPGDGTLFLFNGKRMVGGGFSTRPDPSVVPPGALERVEVVLGGGSAVYGSDAVAGTINFITRRSLNGAELQATYGGADEYSSFDVNGAWGKTWSTGNVMLSFDYAGHSDILGRDRAYYTNDLRPQGGSDFRLTSCPLANVRIGSTSYAYPALAANSTNFCDPTNTTDIYPRERRWSVLGSFHQQITDSLEFGFDGYYSKRTNRFLSAQPAASGTITAANPFFQAPPSAPAATSETVNFNFASVLGDSLPTYQDFKTWQVMPTLKWEMGGNWRTVATLNYGYGDGVVHQSGLNTNVYRAALAGTTTSTALNPFNLGQTNPAILAQIGNFNQFDNRVHKIFQTNIVVDGPLAHLPAGDLKLAVGVERYYESQYSVSAAGPFGQELAFANAAGMFGNRVVKSAFAELVVPVFGPENALPGFQSLTFDFSGRYDHYSDFGGTWNPRLAVTWKPVSDLSLRADYSTAFVAASLNSTTKPQVVQVSATTTNVPPGGVTNRPQITIQGGNPNLKPETAEIYDLGADWTPSFAPGLKLSTTYYHIDFRDLIGGPQTSLFFSSPTYGRFYSLNPTSIDQVRNFNGLGSLPVAGNVALDAFGLPQIVVDSRTANLGRVVASGIDYSIQYLLQTEIGSFIPSVAGTHGLRLDTSTPTGAPFLDNYDNGYPRDLVTASLTYRGGPVRARVNWDYLGGFPVQNVVSQTYVKSFQTINLYLNYKLANHGVLADSSVSVHVDNLFDTWPSYQNIAGGIGNGSTVGRFASISFETKF